MARLWFLDLRNPDGAPGEVGWRDGAGPFTPARLADLQRAASGRELVLITHGFNVSRADGIAQLSATAKAMDLFGSHLVIAVLWPGSFVVPVINYPFEHKDAVKAGQRLARLLARLPGVAGLNAFSHSLGARVMLELARHAVQPLRLLCLTAAAADDNIFKPGGQYADVLKPDRRVVVLHSRADRVLRIAYPAGDFLSDLFLGDRDSPWAKALGFSGPRPITATPREIPRAQGFDHGDYIGSGAKPGQVARLFRDFLVGSQSAWPP